MPKSLKPIAFAFAPLLFCGTLCAGAQQQQDRDNFYNGVRDGGRGEVYDQGHDHDYRRPPPPQGGIGPGKGALIGAGGGAVLGALFGGTKGALVGGAAGAGIGAIAGQEHQQDQRSQYYRR